MVNGPLDDAAAAERDLALGYAPADTRVALATLFALDARLRRIALAAREPLIGTMRLTWWREALERLDAAPAPAEPLLRALAAELLPRGVTGAALAALTDGWEQVLAGEVDWCAVAQARGATLFALAGRLLRDEDARLAPVGTAWARVDLVRDWPAGEGDDAVLADAFRRRWPVRLRALGAMGLLARFDRAGRHPPGGPRRVARLLAHRLTGR